jgi:capsular exopolysaccharide synthesis family protein
MSDLALSIDEHLVTLVKRSSPEAEQYNSLRYAIERARGGNAGAHVLAVTSPIVGDGKTTTAVNLAGVLAHRPEARVILIDSDLRCPAVGRALGLPADDAGFVDVMLDPDLPLTRVAKRLDRFNLSVLTRGRATEDPFELLRTPRAAAVIEAARRHYEYIVLDTSPLLLVPDTRILEGIVDGYLLVVAAHRTPRRLVEDALNLMPPAKLLGLVFNGADQPVRGYYGYGYGYGHASAASRAPKRAS